MIRTVHTLILSFAVLGLAGCSSVKGFSGDRPQLVAAPDSVSAMLAQAADRSSKALETLAAVEYARTPDIAAAPIGNAPVDLRRAITVNWVGPADIIIKTIADRAGYRFAIAGTPPAVPLVVSLDAQNVPLIEVLRDIGLQMGNRADMRVDAGHALIELHYAPNTGPNSSLGLAGF